MEIILHDIDIATNATPQQVISLFTSKGYKVIPTGKQFGTVTVIFNSKAVEITTYRTEGRYDDSRHPSFVKWETDIKMDLSRRDFSINAIALNPITGKFIDPYGGRQDIKNHILRAVGNPNKRFSEDPLRMMRFVRFIGKFGFKPDKVTLQSIKKNKHLLLMIPKERVRDELLKTLESDGAGKSIRLMVNTGLSDLIIPELSEIDGMPQDAKYHKYDVLGHSIKTMENLPKDRPILRLVGLLHDIKKPDKEHADLGAKRVGEIADELKLSKSEKEYLKGMVEHHMDFLSYGKKITPRDARRYLNRLKNKDLINDLVALSKADNDASGMRRAREFGREFEEALKEVQIQKQPTGVASLKIRGGDVMALGLRGPDVGRVLHTLAEEVVEDPEKNTREYLLRRVKEFSKYL